MVTHDRNEAYRNCRRNMHNKRRTERKKYLIQKNLWNAETVGAARISGCKIYIGLKKLKRKCDFCSVSDIYLKTDEIIREKCGYVGLRAHYFRFDGGENEIVCETERVIEDVFSTIIMLSRLIASLIPNL